MPFRDEHQSANAAPTGKNPGLLVEIWQIYAWNIAIQLVNYYDIGNKCRNIGDPLVCQNKNPSTARA